MRLTAVLCLSIALLSIIFGMLLLYTRMRFEVLALSILFLGSISSLISLFGSLVARKEKLTKAGIIVSVLSLFLYSFLWYVLFLIFKNMSVC